ncbi:MAG: DUF4998 domain-containing protein [Tannerella sp.]|jgi:hypothetical protein|nr:DUF4998 domain-containing protein [Tannerella sp.]
MKNIYILIALIVVSACSKMNDLHDKFLDGEVIYAAKVDSADVLAGKNRALLNLDIRSQRIETVRIYWNNYADSADVNVNNQVGEFPKMLDNLPENGYVFQLVSFDKAGNASLPFETSGSVYGDRFQSRLSNRAIQSVYAGDEGLTVNWSGPVDNSLGSNLVYTDKSGNEQTIRIPVNDNSTHIDDWSVGLKYNTLFLPEPTAIDTFASDWRSMSGIPFKYSSTGWTATCRDGNHNWGAAGGEPDKVLDGDINTGWHTRVGSSLPQCMVVDMQNSRLVDHLVFRFQPNAVANNWIYIKTLNVYLTDTPATPDVYQEAWGEPVAVYNYPGEIEVFTVTLNPESYGRYLVLYFPDSKTNTYISFTELEVYRE